MILSGRQPRVEGADWATWAELTATVTATSAADPPPLTHDSIQPRSGLITRTGSPPRLKRGRSGIEAVPPRLLPILLPSRRTTLVPSGQLWNVGPAHEPQWTAMDDAPIPTDKKVEATLSSVAASCPRQGSRTRRARDRLSMAAGAGLRRLLPGCQSSSRGGAGWQRSEHTPRSPRQIIR
jgi:hypothetical protein